MRFLGIGECNDLGDMYIDLARSGHEVRVYVSNPEFHHKLDGFVRRVADWKSELSWVHAAGKEGVVIFETTTFGSTQDQLRRAGYNVIGGSEFGDRLENDRAFGQEWLRKIGLRTASVDSFNDAAAADEFLRRNPQRYVLKFNGPHKDAQESFISEFDDGRDLRFILNRDPKRFQRRDGAAFVLMAHIQGVEVGVGAYFNGQRFMEPVCIDWEHKRFFDGDKGEMTGEMGTLVSYRNARPLFDATLGRMADALRLSRYVGYINLNTIVNDQGIWPLEFTCRFGYPGFAILAALHQEEWGALFQRMVSRECTDFLTSPGFAIGVVLTIPPFPFLSGNKAARGWPVHFREPLAADDQLNLHFDEVAISSGQLVTTGPTGYVLVATGTGHTVAIARKSAYSLLGRIAVPNGRYRTDIGSRFENSDRAQLRRLNLWPMDDF